MIAQLLNCSYDGIQWHHVRMAFSDDMDSIGRFKISKVVHLIERIICIYSAKIRTGSNILYYPPAGPRRVPFYRDAIVLILTRWMFKYTVLHFHASGISSLYPRLSWIEKILFRTAYNTPTVAIRTSALNPDDGKFLNAEYSVVIENGIPDVHHKYVDDIAKRRDRSVPTILFVGALYENKGLRILLEACGKLKVLGYKYKVQCVGRFESSAYEIEIKEYVRSLGLEEVTQFPGVLIGNDKYKAYAIADIFCFPTFFESESFGLVNIEAMQFELPVISTNWRGIPSVVKDGVSGYLVDIQSAELVADKLALLIANPLLRNRMGKTGRQLYLNRYSLELWRCNMECVFKDLK